MRRVERLITELSTLGISTSQRSVIREYIQTRVLDRREELTELREQVDEYLEEAKKKKGPKKHYPFKNRSSIGPAIRGGGNAKKERWKCKKVGPYKQMCVAVTSFTMPSGAKVKKGRKISVPVNKDWKASYNAEYRAAGFPKGDGGGGGEPATAKAPAPAPAKEEPKKKKALVTASDKSGKKGKGLFSKLKDTALKLVGIGSTPSLEWVDYSKTGKTALETEVLHRLAEERWAQRVTRVPILVKRAYGVSAADELSEQQWMAIVHDRDRLVAKAEDRVLTESETRTMQTLNMMLVLKGLVSEGDTLTESFEDESSEERLMNEGLLKKIALKLLDLQRKLLGGDDSEIDPAVLKKIQNMLG